MCVLLDTHRCLYSLLMLTVKNGRYKEFLEDIVGEGDFGYGKSSAKHYRPFRNDAICFFATMIVCLGSFWYWW